MIDHTAKRAPIDHDLMDAAAKKIDELFKGFGFCLLVSEFGPSGTLNYVSNVDEHDMLKALKELVGNMERELSSEAK